MIAMREIELINCTNYFNDVGCKRLKKALDSGKAVEIYIDCIGHAATERETLCYVEWMRAMYGERLTEDNVSGTQVYYLK